MATTIKQLIEILQRHEDQDQPVIYAVFTREDFEYGDGETEVTPEIFQTVVDWHDNINFSLWEDAAETLSNKVWSAAYDARGKDDE